ncbi:unnamed protein product, partial [Cochlearia groenlandica]
LLSAFRRKPDRGSTTMVQQAHAELHQELPRAPNRLPQTLLDVHPQGVVNRRPVEDDAGGRGITSALRRKIQGGRLQNK